MATIRKYLKCLESANYLAANLSSDGIFSGIQLLSNGEQYSKQLQYLWLHARGKSIHIKNSPREVITDSLSDRLSFVESQHFLDAFNELGVKHKASLPCVIKFQQLSAATNAKAPTLQLISDYYFTSQFGLENFYNIQRESKIWWMRLTANPSRYYVEPYDLKDHSRNFSSYLNNCQSITIKSRIQDFEIEIEHLTLIPLTKIITSNAGNFRIVDGNSQKSVTPSLIRSVINLDVALCALLLDGLDHNRQQTLLLNRKIAPYQCAIVCEADPITNSETRKILSDLRTHLIYVLRRANVRVFEQPLDSMGNVNNQLDMTDKVGIPYSLHVTEETLENGMCGLRSRDTMLTETLHISHLQNYIANILTH